MFARVIVDITHTQVDRVFEYSIPDGMPVSLGMRVLIPFGRSKTVEGFVIGTSGTIDYDAEKIKPILSVLESFSALSAEQIELGQFIAKKYNTTLAAALRLMIPAQLRGGRVSQKTQQYVYLNVQGDAFDQAAQSLHTKDGKVKYRKQLEILERLKGAPQGLPCATFGASSIETLVKKGYVRKESKEISRLPFKMNVPQIEDYVLTPVQQAVLMKIQRAANRKFLLHGVTGSGKTEIYVRLIRQCLKSGKTAIMLVPEISLTAQTYRFLKQRFSEEMAVFHSALSAGERYDEWLKVKRGKARIVLGARSAVFAPLENIGAIIIDEEHETSYKSDQYPKYTAHEIAEKRCELNGAILVLGSATPKIETYFRAKQGKLELLRMPERLFDLPLPKVEIVDMREELKNGNRGVISGRLHEEMTAVFENKKQVMLFLNRRGYSTFVMCRGCGYTVKCDSCDVSMTYHKDKDELRCHYCGRVKAPGKLCPECNKPYLKYFGTGTQQVEEQVKKLFPHQKVLRMDVDTMSAKDSHTKLFEDFSAGKADILLGTQMITKGFDFEGVQLSAILAADTMLNFPDYRSAERTFEQITQVAGRAGRKSDGKVILQTYNPEHYAVQLAAKHDYEGFYAEEMKRRSSAQYPPLATFVQILFSGEKEEEVILAVKDFLKQLKQVLLPAKNDIISIHAAPSAIRRINDMQRYQILIHMKNVSGDGLIGEIYDLFSRIRYKNVLTGIDINPENMA